jgi:dipeptidyl aminopeptidase/acylaminoacyl peptidase
MLGSQSQSFGILIASTFVVLVVSGLTGDTSASSQSTPLPANGKIAYIAGVEPGGGNRLRTMNDDGSDVRDVTRDLNVGSYPDWSPDGTRLAFSVSTAPGGPDEIYVTNADGSGLRQLTANSSGFKSNPSWSPDGSRIAFWKYSPGHSSLYMMDADGGNQTLVMEDAEVGLWDRGWSPDGSRIAFTIDYPDDQGFPKPDIYIMNADGGGRTRLTDTPGFDGDPNWSPDGSKIVFTSGREGFSAIYIMNPDGSDQRHLIPGHCAFLKPSVQPPPSPAVCLGDEHPTWSPDGTMIAFVGFAGGGGYSDIFVVDADGTNEKRLTHTEDFEWSPSWQPLPVGVPLAATPSASPTPAGVIPEPPTPEPCVEPLPSGTAFPSSTLSDATAPPSVNVTLTVTPRPTPAPTDPTATPTPAPVILTMTPSPSSEMTAFATAATEPAVAVDCFGEDSAIFGAREQAVALLVLGTLAAGSAIGVPLAAVIRRRR